MERGRNLVVGISGASGAIYGIRLLDVLHQIPEVAVHLVISEAAREIIPQETDWQVSAVEALASHIYDNRDISACISSGTFRTMGMVIAPCSIRTMSSIAHSHDSNLMVRAADVNLKERRRLILLVRETPLHQGHLRSMLELAQNGAIILPPVPAFYNRPRTIQDIVDHSVGKVLDMLDIEHHLFERWQGMARDQVRQKPG